MNNFLRVLLSLSVLLVANLSYAQGELEFGYSKTDGNSDNETLVAGLSLIDDFGKAWRNNLALEAKNSSSEGDRTEEKYLFTEKLDYIFTEKSYAFTRLNYVVDNFSGYDSESSFGLGYGRQLIKSEVMDLKMEGGPGYRLLNPVIGGTERDAIFYFGETFDWKFSETASFIQSLSVETGSDNTVTELALAIKSALTKSLSLKVYAKGVHRDEPGVLSDGVTEADDLDTETGVSISYSF